MKKNIVLIGFMGSGKTTVGIQLSFKMKAPVDDTDKMIERKTNRSISDIFATDGETYFRDLETSLLEEIGNAPYKHIISLGGGTPVRSQNQPLIKKLGYVVYLRVSPATVYERLKGDTTRPLLQGENPLEKITALLESRREAYEECADLIIDVDDMNVEAIVNEIVAKVK